jgi:hypothetical protein
MKFALIGAELEENLGLRYIASSLESRGHSVAIVPYNSEQDAEEAIRQTLEFEPQIAGLSMIFTSRGREFCRFAEQLRNAGYADAAAKAGTSGGAYSGAVEVAPEVWVYQMTKNGLALQLTLQGTKYYKDDDLNKTESVKYDDTSVRVREVQSRAT